MTERRLTPAEIEELLGAYALDAVDPDEARQIADHLRTDPRLQAEVDDYREVAALLAYRGDEAPPDVWDRISDELEGEPPPMRLSVGPTAEPATTREGVVVPLRRRALPVVGGAVAAALLLVVGLVAVFGDGDDGSITDDVDAALVDAADRVFDDPSARLAQLDVEDGGDVLARAAVLADGTGFLVSENLPPLAADRTYQLWGVAGDEVISLGVLGHDPQVASFEAGPGVSTLVLTEEVAGGVGQSENPALGVGHLD